MDQSDSTLDGDLHAAGPGGDSTESYPSRDEDEPSPAELEECLGLLDEVWPRDEIPEGLPSEVGRFRILGELGRGGFGVVFLAEDTMLGRRVALKVPRVDILTGSESWRRFLREVRAASLMDHPHLVPLLEAGAAGPVGYIVSTYVPGPSLERWLKVGVRPPRPRWSASLVVSLARAVEHVHGRNILHRDLKPANVLLDAPGYAIDPVDPSTWECVPDDAWIPRICDFGLAKLHEIEEEETRSRVVCGSPPYMAPEQAESRRDEIGRGTDVYGLGTILYELLAGRPPFGGKDNLETIRRVISEEPVPPRRRRPDVPRDLETICLKCLAKRPDRRYASAADLADDLGRFLEGRPIAARPAPAWERAVRWARRNPAMAALAAAVMIAMLAGACGLLWHESVLRGKNEELRREALLAEQQAREADAQHRLADEGSRLLRRQYAGSQLFQAQQAVKAGQFERARRLLEFTSPEFGPPGDPTFGWAYLRESVRDHLEVFEGHGGMVDRLAISADGRVLASGDDRGEVRLWDVEGGRCRLVLPGSGRSVGRLALSRDGAALASADRKSGEVRIWDASSGRCRGLLGGTGVGEPLWALAFERDARQIRAIGPGRDAGPVAGRRWDLAGATDPFPEASAQAGGPAPPPDEGLRYLVDLLDGLEPAAPPATRAGIRGSGSSSFPEVAVTRDRAVGIVGAGEGVYHVMRGGSWTRLATVLLRPPDNVVVDVAPRGGGRAVPPVERKLLGRLADGLAPGWRKKRGSPEAAGRAYPSWSSTTGPDGGELALWNEMNKRLSLIAVETGRERPVTELGPLTGVHSMALGPDGATLAVGKEDHRILVWHRRPHGRTIATQGHPSAEAWAVAFAPDGRTLASGGDDAIIRLWDAETGRETARLEGQVSLITSLAFSPDGRTLASGSFDRGNPVMLWDVASRRPVHRLRGHRDHVRSVAFSPDGVTLASSGDDEALRVWDARDGHSIATIALGHPRGPGHLAISPDGRTIAGSDGPGITLVDPATGRVRSAPADDEVGPLAFSPDGSTLIGGLRDGSICHWEVEGFRPIRKVQGHAGSVLGLSPSPDGLCLALAGEDGTVRIWDAATGQELLCLTDCRARVNSVAFSPDGMRLAAADHSGAVVIWDARPRR